ncbi:hypothetical protein ACPROK_03285 [Glutamicibacter soli]|uniref:hypothetical protein n=1 Tax=Glutamicibacter soli TaxID=453836 RepID=UPI003C76D96D
MSEINKGLRCQDIHSGVRNVDPNSSLLSSINDTRLVGMAASIATLIRGRDVISDAQALKAIAAEQLDVNLLSFDSVIGILEESGFVNGVIRKGGKVLKFTESVPYFEDLYSSLGDAWENREPTEIEQQLLLVVDELSLSPVAVEELESSFSLDKSDLEHVMEIGKGSGLIGVISSLNGDIAYSPFFGFEQPELLVDLADKHGNGQLAEEFEAIRKHQGLALSDNSNPLALDAVSRGIIMAPAVTLPNGNLQPFAALPYVPDNRLLTTRKAVLDKALAVLACLRCAEFDGGYNSLNQVALIAVIDKLLDQNRGFLAPHSSHKRQYNLMYLAGIITFDPDMRPGGSWVTPRFLDTEDNREALVLARDLIEYGEGVNHRISDGQAIKALNAGHSYVAPMQTMHRSRTRAVQSDRHFVELFEAAMGRS